MREKRNALVALMILTILGFTTTFGSIMPKAANETVTYNGPIDCTKFTKDVNEPDQHWSWNQKTKTLTLAGVHLEGYNTGYNTTNTYVLTLPQGATVVVKEGTVNELRGRFSSCAIRGQVSKTEKKNGGITITGGGVINFQRSEICIYSATDINIKDTTLNFSNLDVCTYLDSYSDGDSTLTIDNSKITVADCTGGFYTCGDYSTKDITTLDTKLYRASAVIKDSDIKMDVKLDEGNERNHSCFLVRNGALSFVNTNLDLKSYHTAVNVWEESAPNTTISTPLITMKEMNVLNGNQVATVQKELQNNHFRAETFSTTPADVDFTFTSSSLSFDHEFTNASKEVKVSAFPKYTVTFDANGGSAVRSINVVSGRTVGTLPTTKRTGYKFLGWSTKKNGSVNVKSTNKITGNTKFYACWSKLPTNKPTTSTNKSYRITSKNTVTYVRPAKKTITSVTIPATVRMNKRTYKVTAISKSAFANCKKLTKVSVGKYVKTISANAFYKCSKLKSITVKSSVLKSVGKNALKGTNKKLTIKVPKKKKKAYKKVFKSKGNKYVKVK